MANVTRLCPPFWGALLCVVSLVGCNGKEPTENDMLGTWAVTDESRSILPAESRQVRAKLTLKRNGEFVSDGVPPELLYSMPGMASAAPVSGTGTWKLGKVDGELALLLTYRAIDGPTEFKVPNGTRLLMDTHPDETELYFFLGDPDQGKRVDFRKLK